MWTNLIDQYKKDLNEFVTTVKDDTSQVLNRAAARLNEDESVLRRPRPVKQRSHEQIEATLSKVTSDPSVLLSFSDSDEEMYKDFSEFFDLTEQNDLIASILNESEEMKKVYSDLCPSKLTHKDFWCRYFFLKGQEVLARHRVGELEEEEEDLTWEGDEDEDDAPITANTVKDEVSADIDVADVLKELEALKLELKRCKVDLASAQSENSRLKALADSGQGPGSETTTSMSAEEHEKLKKENETLRAENEELRKVVSLLNEEDDEDDTDSKKQKEVVESDGKQDDVEVVKSQKESEDWEGEGWSEWE